MCTREELKQDPKRLWRIRLDVNIVSVPPPVRKGPQNIGGASGLTSMLCRASLPSGSYDIHRFGENLIKANSAPGFFEHLLKMEVAVLRPNVYMPRVAGFHPASTIRAALLRALDIIHWSSNMRSQTPKAGRLPRPNWCNQIARHFV